MVPEIEKRLASIQYEEAAEDLMKALQVRRFQDLLSKHYGDKILAGKDFADAAVTELPYFPDGPLITTNFDRVLEHVFEAAGMRLQRLSHKQISLADRAFQRDEPFLLKLHGDWAEQQTRVLTLSEYKEVYGDVDSAEFFRLPIPKLLYPLLATRCFLFVGCSLRQDRTMRVLKRVFEEAPDIEHYALVARPNSAVDHQTRATELSAQSIRPIWYPPGKHVLLKPVLAFLAERSRSAAEIKLANRSSASPTARIVPNNIPIQTDETIGREVELLHVSEMLRRARLVSITGAGGCGKSRLAIDVAHSVKERYEHGVWFIPLADLAKKADKESVLPSRIARIIGVPEQVGRPPNEALAERFALGKYLLVLDNCEHLIQSTRDVAAYLLQQCPGLTILTTTRRSLRLLAHERLYPLTPLKTLGEDVKNVDEIHANDSVRLFVRRANKTFPGYSVDSSNAESVAKLCRALEGIPLAIEVAAARLGVRSVEQMNRDSRDLLTTLGDLRGGDLRPWKTLTAALRWSYGLLRSHEQLFMRSMTVFDGGWTEQAAEAVYPRRSQDGTSVLNHLQTLHERSLIINTTARDPQRFRFLEPIRQMAGVQLLPEERMECERRHALYFLSLAEKAAPELLKQNQAEWLDTLQSEADNLRAAIRWSISTVNAEVGLRLIAALWRFSEIRGFLREGRERAAQVLAIPGGERFPELRSKVLSGAGMLAYRQGDFDAATLLFEESLTIEQRIENPKGIANALNDLGNVARMRGEYERSRNLYRKALAIEEKNRDTRKIAVAKFNLGNVELSMGHYEDSIKFFNESLQGFRDCGDEWETGYPLNGLTQIAIALGNLELAFQQGVESLAVRRKAGDTRGIADTLRSLSWASIVGADFVRAKEQLTESLSLARGLGDKRGISETLELFALLCARSGETVRSIELFAAAERIRQDYTYAPPPARIAERVSALELAKASVGHEKYVMAWSQGASRNITATIDSVLAIQ